MIVCVCVCVCVCFPPKKKKKNYMKDKLVKQKKQYFRFDIDTRFDQTFYNHLSLAKKCFIFLLILFCFAYE